MDLDDIGDIPLETDDTHLVGEEISEINISDVIEVIQTTDPATATIMFNNTGGDLNHVPSGAAATLQQNSQAPPQQQQQPQSSSTAQSNRRNAFVKITEQPASKALRFRYECEGRSAGSIPGVNSTPENKTFPSIQVNGYRGRAVVVVSCVTKDPPYRPHPHNLVGKEGCKKGVCTQEINSETMSVTFSNLGIQCVKKKDIEDALRVREEIRVDPFRTGFNHRSQPSSIDLNAVRLCFQVFLESEHRGRFTVPLPPVVSDPIYDKKAMSDLVICKLSDCSCSVSGGKDIILLCEKVAKEDISVRFYEEQDGQIVWEGFGDFQHTNVHKQVAISFRTPRYKSLEIDNQIKVFIQLKRPSDGATSESLPFDYLPMDSDPVVLRRKRQKVGSDSHLFRQLSRDQQQQQDGRTLPGMLQNNTQLHNFLELPVDSAIKKEPRDSSPSYLFPKQQAYRVAQASPSPQPVSPGQPATPLYNPTSPYANMAMNMMPNQQQFNGGGRASVDLQPQQHQQQQPLQLQQQQQQQQQHPQQQNMNINFQQTQFPNYNHSLPPSYSEVQNQWNLEPKHLNQQQQQMNNLGNNAAATQMAGNVQNQDPTLNLIDPNIPTNLSSLLDMDSQQLTQLNSAELSGLSLSLLDGHYGGGNGSCADGGAVKQEQQQTRMETEQENMMDSFTRLTTATLNSLTDLSNSVHLYNNRGNQQQQQQQQQQ